MSHTGERNPKSLMSSRRPQIRKFQFYLSNILYTHSPHAVGDYPTRSGIREQRRGRGNNRFFLAEICGTKPSGK